MDELALDRCFWREVSTSEPFRNWLVSKTKFAGCNIELVSDEIKEKWHQRWYRDPASKKDSETDILLIFEDKEVSGRRYALHIENKHGSRRWEPNQAENYRKRADNRKTKWRYADFETILLAPASFIERHPVEAKCFDRSISYEEIGTFIPEFGTACR